MRDDCLRENLGRMPGPAAGPVQDLLAAGDPRGNDLCALASGLDRRKQSLPPDGNREVVGPSPKPEGAPHPAAAGIDLLHAEARNQAQGLEGRTSSHQCLLVAVAVDEDAPLGRPKGACTIPPPAGSAGSSARPPRWGSLTSHTETTARPSRERTAPPRAGGPWRSRSGHSSRPPPGSPDTPTPPGAAWPPSPPRDSDNS